MGRDHNPVPGQWYESLDDEEVFAVGPHQPCPSLTRSPAIALR